MARSSIFPGGYDALPFAEDAAANGLTGTTSKAPTGYISSGDTITLKTEPEPPYLVGLGMTGDSKPTQGRILCGDTQSGMEIGCGGSTNFWAAYDKSLRYAPIKLTKGEIITGQTDNANTIEPRIMEVDVTYGFKPRPWDFLDIVRVCDKLSRDTFTITPAAGVTFNSGAVSLKDAAGNPNKWLDTDRDYLFYGLIGAPSVAAGGGILTFSGLSGDMLGHFPGIPVNVLDPTTFVAGGDVATPIIPIQFNGSSPPNMGMVGGSAAAIIFQGLIGRIR